MIMAYQIVNLVVPVTCLAERNVCALSCLGTADERQQQVMDLLENGISNADCGSVLSSMSHLPKGPAYQNVTLANAPHVEILKTGHLVQKNSRKFIHFPNFIGVRKFPVDQQFINMGLWASTIAFIGLGLLMAVVGAFFAVLNTAGNPVEPLLGILGLFIWNAIAGKLICSFLNLKTCTRHSELVLTLLLEVIN
jgi:hypothetical protein